MNRTPVTDSRQPTDLLRGSGAEEPAGSEPTAAVPRELVHRASADDVLLTGWKSLGDERFSVTANWPSAHEFSNPVHGRHDPVLIVETLRQAAILLCHAEFAVPLEHHFLMGDLHYTSHPEHLEVTDHPAELTLDVVCSDIRRR